MLVVLALITVTTSGAETTVDDYFREKEALGRGLVEYFNLKWDIFTLFIDKTLYEDDSTGDAVFRNLTSEVLQYSETFYHEATLELFTSVVNVSLQSLSQDLNVTCGECAERRWAEITNKTCVRNWMKNLFQLELEKAMEVALNKFSPECSLQICSRTRGNFCASAFQERFLENTVDVVYDYINYLTSQTDYNTSTYLDFLYSSFFILPGNVAHSFHQLTNFYYKLYTILDTVTSIEPFKYDNLLRAKFIHTFTILKISPYLHEPVTEIQEDFTWGVIRSSRGKVEDRCATYRDMYKWESNEYEYYFYKCYYFKTLQSHIDIIRCFSRDELGAPLSWSTDRSAFVHSQCLCVAANGTECRVKAPDGVELLTYCFSVLLRDLQKQVSFRPALTYLDYSLMTYVPTCQFINLLQLSFYKMCKDYFDFENFDFILSVQCSFYGLVSNTLNCTEMYIINSDNVTFLCGLYFFLSLVTCEADVDTSVPFYSPGTSTLVQALTYLDVSVRLLTLVTYLACPQLRNLPGKLLIGYQVTALMRLLVVLARLDDLAVAVHIDVFCDISSTLWLTSFLHFLTSSIKTLRLPDSLSPQEALGVLLRYSFLGWALPAVLSSSFFFLDEAIQCRVMFGQILFALCYFLALLWNIHMFYYNCKFYYDVKKGAVSLKPGVKARTVFTGLFNFVLKTSVVSGVGIIFRLLFTQIQGLEELLGYYHALGTLQGLLVFFFYGCNRDSRDFWRQVLSQKLIPCFRRPQNKAA